MRRYDRADKLLLCGTVAMLALTATLLFPCLGVAEEKAPGKGGEEPINITSKQMEADQRAGVIIFRGDVVAKQQEGVIMSDVLTVTYDENKNISKIVAEENVKINQGDRVATCDKATFYPDEKKVVMEGSPRVWKDGDLVTGEVITLFLDSDRMDVVGVEAVIHPKKKDTETAGVAEIE